VLDVTIVYQFGGKVEPKNVDKVIRSEKGASSSVSKIFLLRTWNDGAVLITT